MAMKHILHAKVELPPLRSIPTELLRVDQFRIELSVRVGEATLATENSDDLVEIVRKLYADELKSRDHKPEDGK